MICSLHRRIPLVKIIKNDKSPGIQLTVWIPGDLSLMCLAEFVWFVDFMIVGMQQLMGFLTERFAQEFLVERLDLRVFVRFAQWQTAVNLIE